jgi:Zn-dependent membrane protease YugP
MMILGGGLYAMQEISFIAILGFGLFLTGVLFSVVTLPVEFNASSRAKAQLAQLGMTSGPQEDAAVAKVLNAAAMTYVAAAAVAILQMLYWAHRLGLIGGRDD